MSKAPEIIANNPTTHIQAKVPLTGYHTMTKPAIIAKAPTPPLSHLVPVEEAESNAMNEFNDRCSVSLDKFGLSPHEQLQFDAILDDIQDEEIDSLDTKL